MKSSLGIHALIALPLFFSGIGSVVAGPIMYVHDSQGNLGTVDVSDGTVDLIGSMGVVLTDIAFDASGDLYGLSFTDLYSVDADTAATTLIGSHSISDGNALVFGEDGTLYAHLITHIYKS